MIRVIYKHLRYTLRGRQYRIKKLKRQLKRRYKKWYRINQAKKT